MADAKNEARRQKILANAQKRLEKLENLKRLSSRDNEDEIEQRNNVSQAKEQTSSVGEDNSNKLEESPTSTKTCQSKSASKEEACAESSTPLASNNTDNSEAALKDNPSYSNDQAFAWFFRKHRLILFLLLAWVVYLVVVKDFDSILAYLIGQELPKSALPTLFLTAFVGVELQVIILEFCLKKIPDSKESSFSFFVLALQLSGVPVSVIHKVKGLFVFVSDIFTDLCVYVFAICVLKTFDDYIY